MTRVTKRVAVPGAVRYVGAAGRVWKEERGVSPSTLLPRTRKQTMATIVSEQSDPAVRPDPSPGPAGRETILLVEDNDRVRSVIRRILDGLGYFVLETGSAEEALGLSRIVVPDLLLTDIELPGMSGEELVGTMRAIHSGLRVLYTSGYPPEPERRWEDESRRIHFLEKPFTPACLAATVRRVLDEGREWADGSGPR